ncbi:hypothetical protein B0H19DRAFT_1370851 [Mycena capillaripes]|nr:hypothetical protein B0H19DRAFT_1370851 [Mycena capillaripes]
MTVSLRLPLTQTSRSEHSELDAATAVNSLPNGPQSVVVQSTTLDAGPCPILAIPFEITVKIFLHCLPEEPPEPNPTEAPMLLSAVCRAWRDMALNTPLLWSSLKIEWRFPEHRNVYRLVESYLTHTTSPSADTLRIRYGTDYRQSVAKRVILNAITRWPGPNVDLSINAGTSEGWFKTRLKLPLLETLTFEVTDSHFVKVGLSAFSRAPSLRNVSLYGHVPPATFVFPWAQLTTFFAESYNIDQCLEVLRQASSLVKCTFSKIGSPTNIPAYYASRNDRAPFPPHLTLQSLTISTKGWAPGADILDYLTLPSLEELTVDANRRFQNGGRDIRDTLPLNRFLSRSPPLQAYSGRLWGFRDAEEDIFAVLDLMPDVASLDLKTLDEGPLLSQFFALLCTSSFFPKLTSCSIAWIGKETHVDYPLIADALGSRWDPKPSDGVAQLKQFTFSHWHRGQLEGQATTRTSDLSFIRNAPQVFSFHVMNANCPEE